MGALHRPGSESRGWAEIWECRALSFDRVDTRAPDLQTSIFYGSAILRDGTRHAVCGMAQTQQTGGLGRSFDVNPSQQRQIDPGALCLALWKHRLLLTSFPGRYKRLAGCATFVATHTTKLGRKRERNEKPGPKKNRAMSTFSLFPTAPTTKGRRASASGLFAKMPSSSTACAKTITNMSTPVLEFRPPLKMFSPRTSAAHRIA
jgi:hypothetical protein